MHELSLCRSIYSIVDRAKGDRRVSQIELQVGMLRQVVPETLQYCWGLVVADTDLADSALDIEHIAVALHCRHCDQESTVANVLLLLCTHCERADAISVVRGEEFLVKSVRFAHDQDVPPHQRSSHGSISPT